MTFTKRLTAFIDLFYLKPFHAVVSRQAFRYIACGGMNFVVTILCYAVAYNFIFAKQDFDLFGLVVISPHVAALGISLPVSSLIGFWMQKNISFSGSPLRGRVQLFRYFLNAVFAALVTYLLTKLFVNVCGIFPTVAQVIIYCISAVFSFFAQKHFTFRGAGRE